MGLGTQHGCFYVTWGPFGELFPTCTFPLTNYGVFGSGAPPMGRFGYLKCPMQLPEHQLNIF